MKGETIQGQGIRGGPVSFSTTDSAPRGLLGSRVWTFPSGIPSGRMGPRGIGGREGRRRREANGEGHSRIRGSGGMYSGPVSLLGCWTWSSVLQGQRNP